MRIHALVFGGAVLLAAGNAGATERSFTYTYETPVLRPGQAEIEPWVTYRTGRDEYYRRYDMRLEFEGGVVQGLQTALYLNFSSTAEDQRDEFTGELIRTRSTHFQGVSNEWKYQLTDPLADPLGVAFYLEGTFAPHKTELEAKALFDKHVGGVIVAFNLVGEYEWEYEDSDTTYTYAVLEADLGAAYELTSAVSLGLELNAPFKFYGTAPPGAENNAVLNAGPAFRARFDGWWVATSVLAQVVALKHATSDHLNLEEHERFQVRTIWGFHL